MEKWISVDFYCSSGSRATHTGQHPCAPFLQCAGSASHNQRHKERSRCAPLLLSQNGGCGKDAQAAEWVSRKPFRVHRCRFPSSAMLELKSINDFISTVFCLHLALRVMSGVSFLSHRPGLHHTTTAPPHSTLVCNLPTPPLLSLQKQLCLHNCLRRYDCGVFACAIAAMLCAWKAEGKMCEEQEPSLKDALSDVVPRWRASTLELIGRLKQ